MSFYVCVLTPFTKLNYCPQDLAFGHAGVRLLGRGWAAGGPWEGLREGPI